MKVKARDWLSEETGRTLPDWLGFVQRRIAKHTRPTKDPNHGRTDSAAWIADIEREVRKTWVTDGRPFDENMRVARTMGLILCAWYARVQRAKSMDPRRPIRLRRRAYDRWSRWQQALVSAIIDERHDSVVFPEQDWESPFLPDATNGTFV